MAGRGFMSVKDKNAGQPIWDKRKSCPLSQRLSHAKTLKISHFRTSYGTGQEILYKSKNIKNRPIEEYFAHIRAYRNFSARCPRKDKAMREKETEQALVQAVKKMGGIAPKWVSPGIDGMPDRIVLLPKGKIAFVEVKAPGKRPRPLQVARHELLRRLGFRVYVLDDKDKIGEMIDEIRTT